MNPASGSSTATTHGAPSRARTRSSSIQGAAKTKVQDYLLSENRFKMLTKSKPEDAKEFFAQAQVDADRRCKRLPNTWPRGDRTAPPPAPAPQPAASNRGDRKPT